MQKKPKRILITGSSAGLGQMTARLLSDQGHFVVIHTRSQAQVASALQAVPNAQAAIFGDLSNLNEIKNLALQANQMGRFDSIIHNAAIYPNKKVLTVDGYPQLFVVNVLAPYMLSALIEPPQRLIYLYSDMQYGVHGKTCINDLLWEKRPWQASTAYSESKLLISMLAFFIAQQRPQVFANTVDPGWVATRMGGVSATDDLKQGHLTQAWLAASDDFQAMQSSHHFYHMNPQRPNPDALNLVYQERLIAECKCLSGVILDK